MKTPLDAWIEKKHGIPMDGREALEAWQMERISEVIKRAKRRSAFFSRLYEGIMPPESLAEFSEYPTTTADDLAREGAKMLTVPQRDITRIVTLSTTGTTGEPKRVFFTESDQRLTVDFFANGMTTLVEKGDSAAIFLPHASPGSVGDLLALGLEEAGVIPVRHGFISDLAEAAEAVRGCDSLIGVPVQVLALAEYCRLHGIETHIKNLLLSTDHVPNAAKRRLNAIWGAEVFEHFGMTETGLGCAIDCRAHAGMHVRENDIYAEVTDGGKPVPDGEWGELTLTTLTREGMPIIRYRTGDSARLTHEPCECGSVLARIEVGDRLDAPGICAADETYFAADGVVDYAFTESGVKLVTIDELCGKLPPYTGKRRTLPRTAHKK